MYYATLTNTSNYSGKNCMPNQLLINVREQNEHCRGFLWELLTLFLNLIFLYSRNNKSLGEWVLGYRMRGQIYSQSGSRVILLDAFFGVVFSLLPPFFLWGVPSAPTPPAAFPHSPALLFILYKYKQPHPCSTHTPNTHTHSLFCAFGTYREGE